MLYEESDTRSDCSRSDSSDPAQTIHDVDLPGRIRAAGRMNLREIGIFFGWEAGYVTKSASDYTKNALDAEGWTKARLLHIAEGYEHIALITPQNPSALGRARQLREIASIWD